MNDVVLYLLKKKRQELNELVGGESLQVRFFESFQISLLSLKGESTRVSKGNMVTKCKVKV